MMERAAQVPRPTESYCVIARGELPAQPAEAAQAVARATGRVLFDVTRDLQNRVGVLAVGLTRDEADRAVGCLSQARVSAFTLRESELVQFPDPVFLETARLGEDALEVADLRDGRNMRLGAVNVPYPDIICLATACVRRRTEEKYGQDDPDWILNPGLCSSDFHDGASINAAYQFTIKPRTRTLWHSDHFLDFFAVKPAHHLRLNAATFNFTQTGMKLQPTSIGNLVEFIQALAPMCEQAEIDPSVRHILDGNPLTNLRCSSTAQYDAYLSWRIQLLYHPDT